MKINKNSKRLLVIMGISAILITLVVAGFILSTKNDMTPTDTKIVQVLFENEESLLSIGGVVGAGIARDEKNYIVGIAVYVEDNMSDFHEIPSKLDGFQVFIKRMNEASTFEKASMIIRKY
jgi:hypothetical protein